MQVDSLRSTQVTMYKEALLSKENELNKVKRISKRNKIITSSSIIASIILAIVCALK